MFMYERQDINPKKIDYYSFFRDNTIYNY